MTGVPAAPVAASPGRLRRALAGVQLRSALAAVGVVAAALVVAAAVLLFLVARSLAGAAESTAAGRAAEVALLVADEGQGGLRETLQVRALSGELVQVLDGTGRVVAASIPQAASQPLSDLRPRPGELRVASGGRLSAFDPDARYVLAARGVAHGRTPYVVLAAISVSPQRETLATIGGYLFGGLPILLGVIGGSTFVFVGRSLRPVENIRRRVAGIGGRRLDERVTVPATYDEVARLAVTMNSMLDRIQAAHESQRRFVADASHELRSPLATLRAGLDLAGGERPSAEWTELHATLSGECDRMTRLVEDLLLLAKADEEQVIWHFADVDLDDLVGDEARRLRTATDLTVDVRLSAVRVVGDRLKLAQALRNVTDNAARHARSKIAIALRREGPDAVIDVADDGPGIPAADRERVFDRFVRLDASRERALGGSGLGLAIVREILTAHQGTVKIDDTAEHGALVSLRLPLVLDPSTTAAARAFQPPSAARR